MSEITEDDLHTIASGVGKQTMKQIAKQCLGIQDDSLLEAWEAESRGDDTQFNLSVLKHWKQSKGGTPTKHRLYNILLYAADERDLDINKDVFRFLLDNTHRAGEYLILDRARGPDMGTKLLRLQLHEAEAF